MFFSFYGFFEGMFRNHLSSLLKVNKTIHWHAFWPHTLEHIPQHLRTKRWRSLQFCEPSLFLQDLLTLQSSGQTVSLLERPSTVDSNMKYQLMSSLNIKINLNIIHTILVYAPMNYPKNSVRIGNTYFIFKRWTLGQCFNHRWPGS